MTGWRPALRIARRTVLRSRSRSRSLLIALLIALPVAAATYADVIVHTFGSPELAAQRIVGSADGAITVTPARRLPEYDPLWLIDQPSVPAQRDPAKVDVGALLPSGSRLVAMPRYQPVALKLRNQVVRSRILVGNVRAPMEQFLLRLENGSRAPRSGEGAGRSTRSRSPSPRSSHCCQRSPPRRSPLPEPAACFPSRRSPDASAAAREHVVAARGWVPRWSRSASVVAWLQTPCRLPGSLPMSERCPLRRSPVATSSHRHPRGRPP